MVVVSPCLVVVSADVKGGAAVEVLKKVYKFFSSVFVGVVAEGIWVDDK